MSGRIIYYSNALPVDGVTVALGGSSSAVTQTDSTGAFSFGNIDAGVLGIEPLKSGDAAAAISALDAVYALQAAVNLRQLTPEQQLACDVNGDGVVTALDATLMLQHAVGLIDHFPVGDTCGSDWAFIPIPTPVPSQQLTMPQTVGNACQQGSISWVPLTAPVQNQDFAAVLFGDCTGNWQPQNGTLIFSQSPPAQIHVGPLRSSSRRHSLRAPLYVDTSDPFQAFNAELHYDPEELTFMGVRGVLGGRRAIILTNPRVPGTVRLALASTEPLTAGTVVMLEFRPEHAHPRAAVHVAAFQTD